MTLTNEQRQAVGTGEAVTVEVDQNDRDNTRIANTIIAQVVPVPRRLARREPKIDS